MYLVRAANEGRSG